MQNKHMKKFFTHHKKATIITATLLVGALVTGGAYWYTQKSTDSTDATTEVSGINYGPATAEEKQQNADHKDKLVAQQNAQSQAPTMSSGKRQVTPVITGANSQAVGAYIPSIFEDGGSCTATFTQGSARFTKTNPGFADATTTGCVPFQLSPSDFSSKGEWSVTVSYNSNTSEGSSQAKVFTVQ